MSAEPPSALGFLGLGSSAPAPLAVSYPSPMLLLHYPLIATNVRILCDSSKKSRGQSSLATILSSLRQTYRLEGVIGLYRGAHLYLLHQAARDSMRLLAERAFQYIERRLDSPSPVLDSPSAVGGRKAGSKTDSGGDARQGLGATDPAEELVIQRRRSRYVRRIIAKYLIEVLTYPVLLASTRFVVLYKDPNNTWQNVCMWCQEEGVLSLFSGIAASLLSTALDEIAEIVLAGCIDYCAKGCEVDMADKLLLKASGSSVVSIFTSPVNFIGVIQRCQSRMMGVIDPEPLPQLVRSLPWTSSAYQLLFYGGVMALNVKLISLKIQMQNETEED